MADREPWFAFRRAPGKISATPVHPAGWAALIGFVSAATVLAIAAGPLLRAWHPLFTVAAMLLLPTAAILGFMRWVVIPHGRDIDA